MTKKFRIWGLVQDRLSPGFALHVHPMFKGGGNSCKGADSDPSAVGHQQTIVAFAGMSASPAEQVPLGQYASRRSAIFSTDWAVYLITTWLSI